MKKITKRDLISSKEQKQSAQTRFSATDQQKMSQQVKEETH